MIDAEFAYVTIGITFIFTMFSLIGFSEYQERKERHKKQEQQALHTKGSTIVRHMS